MTPIDGSGLRLLVTGATGRTGSRVVQALLGRPGGPAVRALVRPGSPRASVLGDPATDASRGLERVLATPLDPEDPAPWREAVRGRDVVLHLAGIGLAPGLARACMEESLAGGRAIDLLAVSSTRRFTRYPDDVARTVVAAESRLRALEAESEGRLRVAILRPTMIHGDGDRNLAPIARWIRSGRPLPLLAGGRTTIQPIHVADLADALVRAVRAPGPLLGRDIELSGPDSLTWREAFEELGRAVGRRPRLVPVPFALVAGAARVSSWLPFGPRVRVDQVRRLLEDKAFPPDEAIRALPGWRPRPFAETARELLARSTTPFPSRS